VTVTRVKLSPRPISDYFSAEAFPISYPLEFRTWERPPLFSNDISPHASDTSI
jgi:hypothetical protein